jgi:hypothetical protein
MENMRPENSFPQICVVSGNHSLEKSGVKQEHLGSVDESNTVYLSTSQYPRKFLLQKSPDPGESRSCVFCPCAAKAKLVHSAFSVEVTASRRTLQRAETAKQKRHRASWNHLVMGNESVTGKP